MTIKRKDPQNKRKDLKKKIASLSALGAGALVFGVGNAEAGVIYSGAVNAHVGFGSGGQSSYVSPGLGAGSAFFSFFRSSSRSSSSNSFSASRLIGAYGCGCLQLAQQLGLLQLVDGGVKWTLSMIPGSSMLVGGRAWAQYTSHFSGGSTTTSGATTRFSVTSTQRTAYPFGLAPFNDKYALFHFVDGPNTLFGWIHLSFSMDPQFGSDPAFGPDLTVHDWAFDDSGQLLAAGDTLGDTSTPEPGTLASTGLAALALGAVGLRNWRKSRKAA